MFVPYQNKPPPSKSISQEDHDNQLYDDIIMIEGGKKSSPEKLPSFENTFSTVQSTLLPHLAPGIEADSLSKFSIPFSKGFTEALQESVNREQVQMNSRLASFFVEGVPLKIDGLCDVLAEDNDRTLALEYILDNMQRSHVNLLVESERFMNILFSFFESSDADTLLRIAHLLDRLPFTVELLRKHPFGKIALKLNRESGDSDLQKACNNLVRKWYKMAQEYTDKQRNAKQVSDAETKPQAEIQKELEKPKIEEMVAPVIATEAPKKEEVTAAPSRYARKRSEELLTQSEVKQPKLDTALQKRVSTSGPRRVKFADDPKILAQIRYFEPDPEEHSHRQPGMSASNQQRGEASLAFEKLRYEMGETVGWRKPPTLKDCALIIIELDVRETTVLVPQRPRDNPLVLPLTRSVPRSNSPAAIDKTVLDALLKNPEILQNLMGRVGANSSIVPAPNFNPIVSGYAKKGANSLPPNPNISNKQNSPKKNKAKQQPQLASYQHPPALQHRNSADFHGDRYDRAMPPPNRDASYNPPTVGIPKPLNRPGEKSNGLESKQAASKKNHKSDRCRQYIPGHPNSCSYGNRCIFLHSDSPDTRRRKR